MSESPGAQPSAASLFAAIEADDVARIAASFLTQSFTLFDVTEETAEASDDETAALTAEVEDFPVLVAFTSESHASDFAGAMPDLFETDADVPAFIMHGGNLLAHLPEGFGILLNPESDDCYVLPPDMVDALAAELGEE